MENCYTLHGTLNIDGDKRALTFKFLQVIFEFGEIQKFSRIVKTTNAQ